MTMGSSACRSVPEKIRIARSFGKAAANYDHYACFQRDIADRMIANIGPATAGSILDLGSGTGYCAGKLRALFPRADVTGMDIAEAMVVHANRRAVGDNEHWVCADAERLPFADNSFDLVVSNLTLQWCERLDLIYAELSRVMKPGAKAFISTLAENTLKELKSCWADIDPFVHVNTFRTVQEITHPLDRSLFSAVKWDNRSRPAFYSSFKSLAAELKGIGAHNINAGQPRGLTGKAKLAKLKRTFEQNKLPGKGIPVTYDLVYFELTR